MLKASISSKTVFTKAFLSKESDPPAPHVTNNQINVDPKIQHQCDRDPDSSPHFNIKIFYDRHRKRVMYAECKHDFVDLLLSFLTYPVGCSRTWVEPPISEAAWTICTAVQLISMCLAC